MLFQRISGVIFAFIVFSFGLFVEANTNDPKHLGKPIVVMISIDGFRNDYLQKYRPPTLLKLSSEGTTAQGLIPSFPSLTFPNHVTLVTGRAPGNHGIVSNFFFDKKRKAAYQMNDSAAVSDGTWYRGEPLWTVAEKSGMLSATCFWVGSEAKIGGVDPTYLLPYDGSLTSRARIEKVIQWLSLPEKERPHFVTLYFSDVDSMGHKFGPDSTQVQTALKDVDAALGELVTWVDKSRLPVQFIVVSDHGMMNIKERIDITNMADFSQFNTFERGATMQLYARDPKAIPVAYQSLKKNQKNFKAYLPSELPARWKMTDQNRTGDIVLVAEPGYYLTRKEGFSDAPERISVATHGWDPAAEQMKGVFIARGSLIRSGMKIAAFQNTDVYSLVLQILSLKTSVANDSNPNTLKPILNLKRKP